MGHYARVIRGGKVLDTDTDKILLEDGNCILYEENGDVVHIEKVNKDNNSNCALLRAHYPNDFFTGDDLLLENDDKILLEDDSGDKLIQEDFSYWIKTSYNCVYGEHYVEGMMSKPTGIEYKTGRKNYAKASGVYSGDRDMFHDKRPKSRRKFNGYREFESWILTDNGEWISPLGDVPTVPDSYKEQMTDEDSYSYTHVYHWQESLYEQDNTQGWILIHKDTP